MVIKIYADLDQSSIRKCKTELKENEEQIQPHIESLRKWVKAISHLEMPTGDEFLLRFLRAAKYDHGIAHKLIDNFCTLRASQNGCPTWFNYSKLNDGLITQVLDLDLMVPMGVSDDGQLVILSQFGRWDPDVIPFESVMQVLFMGIDLINAKDEVRIHGVSVIMDLDRANAKVSQIWKQSSYLNKWSKIWQDTFPMRLKNLVFYREPIMFDILYSMSELSMKTKLKKRTIRLKNDIEKMSESIPGLMRILPFEYNGQKGPFDAMKNKWKKEYLADYKSHLYLYTDISVDETKRPTLNKKLGKERDADKDVNVKETIFSKGTYTKFE